MVLVIFIAAPIVLLIFQLPGEDFLSNEWQYFIFALFLVPILVAFIGVLIISTHPQAFRVGEVQLASTPPRKQEDEIIHHGIGFLIAILQDFSRGEIIKPDIYGTELKRALEAELNQLQVYFDRGFSFHFDFYHSEKYQAYIKYVVNEDDIVIEVDGLFNFYFDRNGEKHPTPHAYDKTEPMVCVPAIIRMRVSKETQDNTLKLIGFSENIRGLQLGQATQ